MRGSRVLSNPVTYCKFSSFELICTVLSVHQEHLVVEVVQFTEFLPFDVGSNRAYAPCILVVAAKSGQFNQTSNIPCCRTLTNKTSPPFFQ